MAFRKYPSNKFGPVFEGGEEVTPPPTPAPIIEDEKIDEEIIETNETQIPNEDGLVRVIDNTNSLVIKNTEKELENEEEKEIVAETVEEVPEVPENALTLIEEEIPAVIEEPKKPILKKVEEQITKATGWEESKEVSFGVFTFKNKSERTVFISFIVPPLVISVISMIHVVSFFELSNTTWLSWALAAAFEFASISALFALTALTKIKKNTIWILFFAIVVMQVIGNMYHSYVHMDPTNPDLLKLLTIVGIDAVALPWTLRILGFLQGGVLPIVALTFVKAVVEYLSVNREENK